tara:strand:- start:1544 stop:1978 length:435 start_codon:yes stop_codon:yes gene_type:complete
MPKEECRESREVPFSEEGVAWAAAAEGVVRETIGADVDAMGRLLPSPSKLLPYQRQMPPWTNKQRPSNVSVNSAVWGSVASVHQAVPPQRTPLAPIQGNVDVVREVLCGEVRALERKLQRADRQIKVQEQLIRGFCNLEVVRKT